MAKKKMPKWTLYYAEYFNDRLGSTVNTGWITRDQLREIARYAKAEFECQLSDDDPTEEELWEKYLTTNDTIYLSHEIFNNGRNALRKVAAIMKAVDGSVSGSWGVRVEGGSIALAVSEQMAIDRLAKLELPVKVVRDPLTFGK